MKDLKAIRGLKHLQQLVEQGEHEHQDFKYMISDAHKIARSISAFSNNDGGRLLIGVKDNGTIAGVRSEEDLYMIELAANSYCRPSVNVEFSALKAGQGAVVYIASIPRAFERPVEVVEPDGRSQAYYRVGDENIVAHPLMVAAWRYTATSAGTLIAATSPEAVILDYMRQNPQPVATHHEIAIACHLSHHSSADAITRLAALGLVTFTFDGTRFVITLPE